MTEISETWPRIPKFELLERPIPNRRKRQNRGAEIFDVHPIDLWITHEFRSCSTRHHDSFITRRPFRRRRVVVRTRDTCQYCPRAWSRYPVQGRKPPWYERALPRSPRGSYPLRPARFDRTASCRSVQGCKSRPRCCQAATGNYENFVRHASNIAFHQDRRLIGRGRKGWLIFISIEIPLSRLLIRGFFSFFFLHFCTLHIFQRL